MARGPRHDPAGHVWKRPDADVSRTGRSSYRRSAKFLPGNPVHTQTGWSRFVMLRRTLRIEIAMVTAAPPFVPMIDHASVGQWAACRWRRRQLADEARGKLSGLPARSGGAGLVAAR